MADDLAGAIEQIGIDIRERGLTPEGRLPSAAVGHTQELIDAALPEHVAAHVALDTDRVPYFDPGNSTYQAALDTDLTPYLMIGA